MQDTGIDIFRHLKNEQEDTVFAEYGGIISELIGRFTAKIC